MLLLCFLLQRLSGVIHVYFISTKECFPIIKNTIIVKLIGVKKNYFLKVHWPKNRFKFWSEGYVNIFSQRKMQDRWTRHNMKKRLSNILNVPTFSGYLFVTVYCIGSSQTKTRSMIISWGWKGKSRFKYRQIDSKRMKIINCPILILEDLNKY